MNRETSFQKNVKYVIYMTAVVCAVCQFILLISEMNYLPGIGMLLNLLYHLAGMACPAFILYLFYSENIDKEIYGSYAIGGELLLGALVSIAILIKYISKTKGGIAFSTGIVVFLSISIVIELLVGFLFFRYGMDRVTCVLPIILLFISLILRDAVLGRVDSKLHIKVNIGVDDLGNIVGKGFKGSFASGWTFLHAFFFFVFVVCLILYVDTRFLEDLKDNPKTLFTKETLFGTYTNSIIKEEKKQQANIVAEQKAKADSQDATTSVAQSVQNTAVNTESVQTVGDDSPVASVPSERTEGVAKENFTDSNSNTKIDALSRKCPDCGSVIPNGANMCMTCGCPMEEVAEPAPVVKKVVYPTGNTATLRNRKCPDCGSLVPEGSDICLTCGCPME